MATGKEAKADHNCGRWLHGHGLDDVFDRGHQDHSAKDLGSIQHSRDLEGTFYGRNRVSQF